MFRFLVRLALLLAICSSAYARNWYVCPDTQGEYGTENGTSRANCFDGANAFRINAAKVTPGDTVYVCGDFTPRDERFILAVSGRPGAYVTMSGNGPACGRTTNSSISRRGVIGSGGRAFAATGMRYVKITEFTIRDCDQPCVSWDYVQTANEDTTLWVGNVAFINCGQGSGGGTCIWKRGAGLTVTQSTFDGCETDCIWARGKDVAVSDSEFRNISNGSLIGDGTQVDLTGIVNSGYTRWFNNYCDHRGTDAKYCFVVGPTIGKGSNVSVYGNWAFCPAGGGRGTLSCHPIYVDASVDTTIDIHSNWVVGGFDGISINSSTPISFANRASVLGNIISGSANYGIWLSGNIDGVDISNNMIDRAKHGIHIGKPLAQITVANNAMVNNQVGLYFVAEPLSRTYNGYSGNQINISESGVERPPVPSDIIASPALVGGTYPSTPDGYRLTISSPYQHAGIIASPQYDYRGCRFDPAKPAIGPLEFCGGAPADTRTYQ